MLPAGEMWSVVTESPSMTRQRAPEISFRGAGSFGMSVKKGGFLTYVEESSQMYVRPLGIFRACQLSSPSKTSPYAFLKCAGFTAVRIASWTSSGVGQMSLRYTGAPLRSVPSGSVVRSLHLARERIRDDERWRGEVVHLDLRVDAA